MEKRTEGAWIIHHTKKIQEVTQASDFEDIELAGKCGLFLSSLAASNEESTLSKEKVEAIAKASNIKKVELSSIKETLKGAHLIDTSEKGEVSVIGITTSNVLSHTADIFNNTTTDSFQKASLELSNYTSEKPLKDNVLKEYIGDTYQLAEKQVSRLFKQAEEIRLIDYEEFDSEKIYFNGNLFKHNSIEKTSKVLSSLSSADSIKVSELDTLLTHSGCVSAERARHILGDTLLAKLQSIAMYDFNEVSNDTHTKVFITKPSSFSKFGNPFEDDALDLAKAFISSLMYGMQVSTNNRGRIQNHSMLIYTVKKLLRGVPVGPCTAIGQDYQVLELNRVIQLEKSSHNMYYMRLLKFDIGLLALDVLEYGDIAEQTTLETSISSSNVSNYSGPEKNRIKARRKKDTSGNTNVGELLRTMRK